MEAQRVSGLRVTDGVRICNSRRRERRVGQRGIRDLVIGVEKLVDVAGRVKADRTRRR